MLRLVVLYWTVQTMMRPLVAPYAYSLDSGTLLVGAALIASAVPAALLCIPVGLWCDRLGFRAVVTAGALASAAGTAAMASLPHPAALLGSQVLFGLGQMAMWVAIQGLMIASGAQGESRRTRARRVVNYSTLGFVGQLAGPLLPCRTMGLRDGVRRGCCAFRSEPGWAGDEGWLPAAVGRRAGSGPNLTKRNLGIIRVGVWDAARSRCEADHGGVLLRIVSR
jgi:MFS family permease